MRNKQQPLTQLSDEHSRSSINLMHTGAAKVKTVIQTPRVQNETTRSRVAEELE